MKRFEYPNLDAVFHPQSIAIVGASDDVAKVSGQPMKYILDSGWKGKVYPVNPTRETILGHKAYPSITAIPDPVDAAVIVIAAAAVPKVIQECADKGVKAVMIGVSGFAELNENGKKLQDEIEAIANKVGMRIVGPNTNGYMNVLDRVTLGYSYAQEVVKPGRVAYVSGSGALISATVPRFAKRNVGLRAYVGGGNQANVELCDYVAYFLDDPEVDVITMYVEGFKTPAKFLDIADRALAKGKPIAILKVGRSEMSAHVAKGHTGALVGSEAVFDAICRQYGIARVDDFDELIATTSVLARYHEAPGNRVGVISSSGGAISIIADQCMKYDLRFPDLSKKTKEEAIKVLPAYGEMTNPFDIAAAGATAPQKAELSEAAVQFVLNDENIDILVTTIHPMDKRGTMNYLQAIVHAAQTSPKPIIMFCPMGGLREDEEAVLMQAGTPVVHDGAELAVALNGIVRYSVARRNYKALKQAAAPAVSPVDVKAVKESLKAGNKSLTEHEGKDLLASYGIPVTTEELATSADQAASIAGKLGYPVVMKVDSPDILHKTEAKAVKLNLRDAEEVKAAFNEIMANSKSYAPKAKIRGVLVQEMATGGREVILGVSVDPDFGPTIMFGLGGILVEVLRDVAMRVVPVSRADAEAMINEIKGKKFLQSFRGMGEADTKAIVDAILKLSRLAEDLGDTISEVDINPLLVFEKGRGAKAVDALITLK
ncbi:MAG: acetate--CoA ligase family protein [Dehalococcoidales bacterium]|jgi:acetyltransferase